LALNTTVLTLQTTISDSARLLMNGCAGVFHHTNVAIAAMINST
jgi:hypothetical protein